MGPYLQEASPISRVRTLLWTAILLLLAAIAAHPHPPSPEVVKMFPLDLGEFHQLPSMRPLVTLAKQGILKPEYFAPSPEANQASPSFGAEAEYLSAEGDKLLVEIVKVRSSDSAAYSLFTLVAKQTRATGTESTSVADVGTASVVSAGSVTFFRGKTFARVTNENGKSSEPVIALARLFSETFDKGEGDIPVLAKHLPDWQTAQSDAVYAVNLGMLQDEIPDQPVLNSINFEGGTEAVVANYGPSQLVIVEFTTPQFAGENDGRITARLQELRGQEQPAPTAYRRVGNYSVFVFNAPDERTANQLIDKVKYEQVVQWLGEDPHWLERAQKLWARTSAAVLVAVLETSGLSLLLCLGIGGFTGAILFRRRRARQAAAFSDAGGMIRLDLDEVTAPDTRKE